MWERWEHVADIHVGYWEPLGDDLERWRHIMTYRIGRWVAM